MKKNGGSKSYLALSFTDMSNELAFSFLNVNLTDQNENKEDDSVSSISSNSTVTQLVAENSDIIHCDEGQDMVHQDVKFNLWDGKQMCSDLIVDALDWLKRSKSNTCSVPGSSDPSTFPSRSQIHCRNVSPVRFCIMNGT